MAEQTLPPPPAPTDTTTTATANAPVGYALVWSYSTVRVLSQTQVADVEYVTIQTQPSNVIASRTVQRAIFDKGEAGIELTNFAQAIEQIMATPHVTSAVGTQDLDDTNLLTDNVDFTVTYTDPVRAPNGATAVASVNVNLLDFSDALIGRTLLGQVQAIIDGVYANLQAAAGG